MDIQTGHRPLRESVDRVHSPPFSLLGAAESAEAEQGETCQAEEGVEDVGDIVRPVGDASRVRVLRAQDESSRQEVVTQVPFEATLP